jgi:hypothetical protein
MALTRTQRYATVNAIITMLFGRGTSSMLADELDLFEAIYPDFDDMTDWGDRRDGDRSKAVYDWCTKHRGSIYMKKAPVFDASFVKDDD